MGNQGSFKIINSGGDNEIPTGVKPPIDLDLLTIWFNRNAPVLATKNHLKTPQVYGQ